MFLLGIFSGGSYTYEEVQVLCLFVFSVVPLIKPWMYVLPKAEVFCWYFFYYKICNILFRNLCAKCYQIAWSCIGFFFFLLFLLETNDLICFVKCRIVCCLCNRPILLNFLCAYLIKIFWWWRWFTNFASFIKNINFFTFNLSADDLRNSCSYRK